MKNRKAWGYLVVSALLALSLLLPVSMAATAQAAGEVIEHQVAEGDNLSLIAGYYYKDPRQWKKIYTLNSEEIGDPDILLPGTTIKVAADPSRQWDIPYRDYFSRVYD